MSATKLGDITLSKESGTVLTLNTKDKFVNNDVSFSIDVISAEPAFDGGELSGDSTATFNNITTSSTDNGIKVQTAYTASRTAVFYNGAVNGWVNKSDNAEALAAESKTSTNGKAYYVTGVTVPKDKGFSVTTTADTALDNKSNLSVVNNAYRNVNITNKANGNISIISNIGYVSIVGQSSTEGNVSIKAYNASGALDSDTHAIVTNGKWVTPIVNASGTYYGCVTVDSGSVSTDFGNTNLWRYFSHGTSDDYDASITPWHSTTAGYISYSPHTNGDTTYLKIFTDEPAFIGGSISGTASASSASASLSNSTNNSGISITASASATRAAINYDGEVSGWVSKSNGDTALAAGSATNLTDTTYYLNGVTLTKPSSGTRSFSVTVPNGSSTATFVFNVDTSGNVTITES